MPISCSRSVRLEAEPSRLRNNRVKHQRQLGPLQVPDPKTILEFGGPLAGDKYRDAEMGGCRVHSAGIDDGHEGAQFREATGRVVEASLIERGGDVRFVTAD